MLKVDGKVVGAISLAAGTGLLVWGYQLYGALGNKLSRAMGGATSNEAVIVLCSGVVLVAFGVWKLLKK